MQSPIIVILDVDETLIHAPEANDLKGEFSVDGQNIVKRPGVDKFLDLLSTDPVYRPAIWSAGEHEYVHQIVDNLFPNKDLLEFVMTRNDINEMADKPLARAVKVYHEKACWAPEYYPEIGIRDMLIIDNRYGVTGGNHLNHLHIIDFVGDKKDNELERLWKYLDENRDMTVEWLAINWKLVDE